MTYLKGVPAEHVAAIWPEVQGLVKKGLDLNRFSPEDVLAAVQARDMQLWLIGDGDELAAIVVTEINVYPRSTWGSVVVVAGKRREAWMDHLQDLEAWAIAQGCRGMEAFGRKGWLKEPSLKSWRLVSVVLEKDFSDVARIAA